MICRPDLLPQKADRKRGTEKRKPFRKALFSVHHTDPSTGKSYQTFAVWTPEGERTEYLKDLELNEKYTPVNSKEARKWWVQRQAAISQVETVEMHIIGGAILPLWQRLKTHEGTRLRVVRVSTDLGQRIVGVWIPQKRVWSVLRALGISHRLESPEEIFNAVLHEGGELTFAANLRLKPGNIHGEKAIELCDADPYKFAQLREMGLINTAISYKQRFFIPTDETKGVEILSSLLQQYPVIMTEDSAEEEPQNTAESAAKTDAIADTVIDLTEWIIPAGELENRESEIAESQLQQVSEITTAEGQPPSQHDTVKESSEPTPKEKTFLFIEVPKTVRSPRGTKHSDRENLGQLAFDF